MIILTFMTPHGGFVVLGEGGARGVGVELKEDEEDVGEMGKDVEGAVEERMELAGEVVGSGVLSSSAAARRSITARSRSSAFAMVAFSGGSAARFVSAWNQSSRSR